MGERADLTGLIERLEAATGPDRELDRAIMALSYTWERRYIGGRCDPSCCPEGAHLDGVWVDPATDRWKTTARNGFEFTASLDAAMALVERVQPGWNCSAINLKPDPCEAYVWRRSERCVRDVGGKGPTPAIALLIALLRTLETEQ